MRLTYHGQHQHYLDVYPWLLALVVLVSRVLEEGPVYFVDGPSHVSAALTRTYLIQPPGYWLFNRLIAFFPDPGKGIEFFNWTFSALGVVCFYYAARLLVQKRTAQLGTAVYAVLFFDWFAGQIHSTYASQLLFPVLLFLFLQLHSRRPRLVYLLGAAATYALGAGFRPSDGFFAGFMFLYYLVRHTPLRQAIVSFLAASVGCLLWLVPTREAIAAQGQGGAAAAYSIHILAQVSPLFHGIGLRPMANVARFVVPLIFAFGPLLFSVLRTVKHPIDEQVKLLWIWIAPGASFLVLFYIGDAPYLTFLTAAILLLALKQLECATPRVRTLLLTCCLLFNVFFFLFFVPLRSKSLAANVINVYAGKYTRFAIRNQWQPNLSDFINRDTLTPKK